MVTDGHRPLFVLFSRMTSPSAAHCYPVLRCGKAVCLPFSQSVSQSAVGSTPFPRQRSSLNFVSPPSVTPVESSPLLLLARLHFALAHFRSTFIISFYLPPSRLVRSLPLSFLLQALSSPPLLLLISLPSVFSSLMELFISHSSTPLG